MAQLFSDGVYFATPGGPWMRGSYENMNRLVHQYLPKSADLRAYESDALAAIAAKLNDKPRKVLGWKTPAEVFNLAL